MLSFFSSTRAFAAVVGACCLLASAHSWSLFFSTEEQPPWKSAFQTTDKDSDGFLSVDDLEPLLRDHFRRTEQDDDNYEMILANEHIFHDQANEVATYFEREGVCGRVVCSGLCLFVVCWRWCLLVLGCVCFESLTWRATLGFLLYTLTRRNSRRQTIQL